jgi:GT2 family glycosyltransferase
MWMTFARLGYWELAQMRNEVPGWAYQPEISILVPVYNPERAWLEKALDSVIGQAYPHWELCVCDDASTESYVREVLGTYERLDSRIRVRYSHENMGIVGATNVALSLASGEFVGLLDHDDELSPNALFEVVKFLQERPDADLIYSDEDKLDEDGQRVSPRFKIGWSPDLAMGGNYLNHFSVYRRVVLEELDGWREGFDGAQDLDLVQRYGERTDKIHHIPKVLYHWRMAAGSTALSADGKPYTHERARRSLEDALKRRGVVGHVRDGLAANTFRIDREIVGRPRVSVVIPTTRQTPLEYVESLRSRTTYLNYEIVPVDIGAGSAPEHLTPDEKVVEQPSGSNLCELYNAAVQQAQGEYVLLLSPHLEATSDEWLENMLQHAQRPEVGAVGGRLILPPDWIFQAGLILDDGARGKTEDDLPRFYRYCDQHTLGHRHFVNMVRNCSAVSSACMMFRREVFEEVGGFDNLHLSAEFADVDLCLRMREHGYLIVYTPYAEFTHHGPLQSQPRLNAAEADYVRNRWREVLGTDPYYNPNLDWVPSDPMMPEARLELSEREEPAPAVERRTEAKPLKQAEASPASDPHVEVERARRHLVSPISHTVPTEDLRVEDVRFFVVGYGRSGTAWLETTLNSHPEVLCLGPGMFFGRNLESFGGLRVLHEVLINSDGLKDWHGGQIEDWREHTVNPWTKPGGFEQDVAQMTRATVDALMRRALTESGKRVLGDRTPHHVSYLDEIHALYPNAKIVHAVRDGRDAAVSNMHAFWRSLHRGHHNVGLSAEEVEIRQAYLEDREAFLSSGQSIFTEVRITELAHLWNHVVRQGRHAGMTLFGDNYFEFRYEDHLDRPREALEKLFRFLEVEASPDVVERTIEANRFERMAGRVQGDESSDSFFRKGVSGDWREVFTERDKRVFKGEAGELLIELGYEKDLDW